MKVTEIEKNIIRCVCLEMTEKEIASTLQKSLRTIQAHKDRIRLKLDVMSNTGIALWAVKNGLFKL